MLKHQKLEKFLNLSVNIYPDVVHVFFTNLPFEKESTWTHLKGVDIGITSVVWTAITELEHFIAKVGKGNTRFIEDYNKIQFFRSCLRNPHATMRGFHGGLVLNPHILPFLVVWQLL